MPVPSQKARDETPAAKPSWPVGRGFVEAARFLGGHSFAQSSTDMLIRD